MRGNILYPLNVLKEKHPETYACQILKYKGREFLLHRQIPELNCLWNDVLHLSPVHPKSISDSLKAAGFKYPPSQYYDIDFSTLDPEMCLIMVALADGSGRCYSKTKANNLHVLADIPEDTVNYYKRCFANKEQPLLFAGIPHILYKGNIDVSKCEIVTV